MTRRGDKIIASARWLDEEGRPTRATHRVFTVREGRIVDWQDCRSRRAAERFARTR